MAGRNLLFLCMCFGLLSNKLIEVKAMAISQKDNNKFQINFPGDYFRNKCQICKFDKHESDMENFQPKNMINRNAKSFPDTPTNLRNKNDYFLSESWGAFGMPFNVLYTPNIYQKNIFKSSPKMFQRVSQKVSTETPQKVPEVLYLALKNQKSYLKLDDKNFKKPYPRKYRSYIPQFFASYGW